MLVGVRTRNFLKTIFISLIKFVADDSFLYDDIAIPKCDSAVGFNCEGGILALDGLTGTTLWQTWTAFNVFSLHCNQDLNGDNQFDCVAAGRGGVSFFFVKTNSFRMSLVL